MNVARTIRFLGAGLVCATVLSACSGSITIGGNPEVPQSDVESQVATKLAAETSQPLPKVSCPSGLPAKVGAAIDCTLTAQGDTTTYPVHVKVTSIKNGTAQFDAQVGQAAGAGDKTAFCSDNATLDMATASVQQPSDLVPIFKANQATLADFQAKAPSDIVSSAGPLAIAADHAVASGDASAFTSHALIDDGTRVDAYCGQNPDGTPVSAGATTTTGP
ncbi:MAG TPA: DUF4333 domain-containing protein [Acidimicrobiales bacterium]|jgi:hypothetical protein|nr:DUF4333 domain-containing protein [Acidimicrobiales bacterium]